MDFRQLRTFVNVAQLGSISLAAERLNVAQSALTRQIQALEAELRVLLLRRHGRGVSPTPEGQLLLERAAAILREVEATRQALKADPDVLTGEVAFGMPPSVADALTAPLMEAFMTAYPKVKLRAVTGASGYVLDWLQRGLIDVGVIYDVKPTPMIETSPLMSEQLYLVQMGPGTAADRDGVTLAEAARHPLVLPSARHGLRQLLDGAAASVGLNLETVAEADTLHVLIDLARRGVAVTILPHVSIVREVEAGALAARPIVAPEIKRHMALARVIDRPVSPAARAFLNSIHTVAAQVFPASPAAAL